MYCYYSRKQDRIAVAVAKMLLQHYWIESPACSCSETGAPCTESEVRLGNGEENAFSLIVRENYSIFLVSSATY